MPQFVDDRYRIIERLGSGGMGEVYLAHDEVLDRDVGIKLLAQHLAEHEESVERFNREARSAASLSHPNIVSVHDRGETKDGIYYIAMEYISGGTLKDLIDREGPLPAARALSIALQVARALRAAHERGVIHRDIKPQNILLTDSGDVKVADFGIARATSLTTLTQTGLILGTPHYISPEQAMGQTVGPKSDLYSLGVVLYEMLTGEVPYDAETPIGVVMKHVNGLLKAPSKLNPRIPEEVNALTVDLLAKDPDRRPPDAASLIARLRWLSGEGEFSHVPPTRETTVPPVGSAQERRPGATRAYTPPPAPPVAPEEAPNSRRRSWTGYVGTVLLMAGLLVVLGLAGAGAMGFMDRLPVTGSSDEEPLSQEAQRSFQPPPSTPEPTTFSPPEDPTDPEAEAEEAAGNYYRAAGLQDWAYTYDHLDSQTQSMFTEEEWAKKNQYYWDLNPTIYHILSVELLSDSDETITEVTVRITGEDGSSFIRTTYWVLEDGEWLHRFSQEEIDLFMPELSYEEFVEANGG